MTGTGLCGSRLVQRGATAVGGACRRFACFAAAAGSGHPQSRPDSRATGSGGAAAEPVGQSQQPQPSSAAKDAACAAAAFEQLSALVTPHGDASAGAVGLGRTPRGRGLVARRAVQAGETLVAVQQRHTFLVDESGRWSDREALADWRAVHGPLPPRLDAYVTSTSRWDRRLVAWLLHATDRRRKGSGGDATVWQLYRATLPREPAGLMLFSPAERRELQCEDLAASARHERRWGLATHRELAQEGLAASLGRTLWAVDVVKSRSFGVKLDNGEALSLVVPCADMANHDHNPNAEWHFADGVFRLVARRDAAPGDEVCVSYFGTDTPNDDILKHYAFVLPGNYNDRIGFDAAALHAGCDGAAKATGRQRGSRAWALAGVLDGAALTAAAIALAPARMGDDPHDGGRLAAALQSLELFIAERGLMGRCKASGAAQRAGADALLRHCGELRAAFATTLEEDAALLVADSSGAAPLSSPRVRAAVEWRLERKRLLLTAEALLRAYAAGLQ